MLPDPLSEAHLLLCIQPDKKGAPTEELSSSADFTRNFPEELRKKNYFLNSRNRSSENTASTQINSTRFTDFSALEQPIQAMQSLSG